MHHKTNNWYGLALCLLVLLLVACDTAGSATQSPPPTRFIPTLLPTGVPLPAATAAPDSGWLAGGDGVELRRLRMAGVAGQAAFSLVIVRLDPEQVRLRVVYAPEQPRGLRAWFDDLHPIVAINGGFFKEDYRSTALVVSDGAASGASYEGFGGMLAVRPDGQIALRALSDQPYDSAEPLAQAIQSFPMLVFSGGQPAAIDDDGRRARRTGVALDRAGRLLLIVSPTGGLTLRGFADWLSASDLEIDSALNLDGGASTGLFMRSGALSEQIESFGPLPLVLLVEPK